MTELGQGDSAKDPAGPPDPSRRRALKALAVIAVGGCVALLASYFLSGSSGVSHQNQTTTTQTTASSGESGSGQTTYSKIKVRYFQMSSTLPGTTEDYFVLPNPATYGDLQRVVIATHPQIAAMMPSMLVLIDGVVAKNDMALGEGDEVDYVPTMSGG
jgi:molybdopterin converting factor small subunit